MNPELLPQAIHDEMKRFCLSLTITLTRRFLILLLAMTIIIQSCHPTEIKLYCRSREFDVLSKTALFQQSHACTTYPESSLFSMGVPGISHHQMYTDFFQMCSPPLVAHHCISGNKLKGLEVFHFVDGDLLYLKYPA